MSREALPDAVPGQGAVLAVERSLPVPEPFATLLPGGGLQRGSLVGVSGTGATTLLLSLLVEPLTQGLWAAVVGVRDLGLEAAAGMGVELSRLPLVPEPGPSWPSVVAVLLDAVELVAIRPPGPCPVGTARRLAARASERGSTLLVVSGGWRWPDRLDLELTADAGSWEGLGHGSGTLRRRPAEIVVSGRRGAGRPRTMTCWLPSSEGRLAARDAAVQPLPAQPTDESSERVAWAG